VREEKKKENAVQNKMTSHSNGRREGKKRELITVMQKHERQAMRKNRENLGYVREIAEKVWMMIERRAPKSPKR